MTTRYLTLIRHAKSSWNSPASSDFERPLNKRGRQNAPRMGRELDELGIRFDKVLCSSAVRARETLSGLRQGMDIQNEAISYLKEMYLAPAERLYDLVLAQADVLQDIALIGHNPGMEDLASILSSGTVSRMPTCCAVRFAFDRFSEDGRVEFIRLARELN